MIFKQVRCPMCNENFVGKKSVETYELMLHHIQTYHMIIDIDMVHILVGFHPKVIEETIYKCFICDIPFKEKTELKEVKQHLSSGHNNNGNN